MKHEEECFVLFFIQDTRMESNKLKEEKNGMIL
jgi:hypothetical protein